MLLMSTNYGLGIPLVTMEMFGALEVFVIGIIIVMLKDFTPFYVCWLVDAERRVVRIRMGRKSSLICLDFIHFNIKGQDYSEHHILRNRIGPRHDKRYF